MAFGIDTFRSHLDLIGWDLFKRTNGGQVVNNHIVGGEPDFAGRNFLGGDFIWGHGEATDALDNPSPEHLEQLNLLTPFIAPMQAPHSRQQTTGVFGNQYGRIDGQAICERIDAGVHTGEFRLPELDFVYIWLCVDPATPFSIDYWAGWSDQVNNYTMVTGFSFATGLRTVQPFRACVSCTFAVGDNGQLRPDEKVFSRLVTTPLHYPGFHTTCYAFWADAPANPPLNWDAFADKTRPLLWRFSHGLRNPAGVVINDLFDVDTVDPGINAPKATNFMLKTQRWQPNVASIQRYGFIKAPSDPAYAGISAADIANIGTHPIPAMQDLGAHYNLHGGQVEVIGRYLKTPHRYPSMGGDEAVRLSKAQFELFTIWESYNDLAQGEPAEVGSPSGLGRGISYFDPALHTGTEDGRNAFTYCGEVLLQPSQTPVFFCVDFDAADPDDPSNIHDPEIGAITNRDERTTAIKNRIMHYFELIKSERDAYAQRNPDRYYLIGLYANGGVNRWCYEQGIVNLFWQSTSPGGTNAPPFRPWYHANRWQFNKEDKLAGAGWTVGGHEVVSGADPDVDWGDGGTWTLADPLEQGLEYYKHQRFMHFVPWMSDLGL